MHLHDSEIIANFGAGDVDWTSLGPSIVFTALSTVVVALRWYTRCKIVQRVGLDDYIILLSLILAWAMCVIIGIEASERVGRLNAHIDDLMVSKLIIVNNSVWVLLINLTKASILAQYLRIFQSSRLRVACAILLSFLLPAAAYGIVVGVILCHPIQKLWNPGLIGKCMNPEIYWVSVACIDIVLDFTILILPMRTILALRLPPRQRLAVVLVFALGFVVCTVSVARLVTVVSLANEGLYIQSGIWAITLSNMEANTGIICASLIALKAFVVKICPGLMGESEPRRPTLQTRIGHDPRESWQRNYAPPYHASGPVTFGSFSSTKSEPARTQANRERDSAVAYTLSDMDRRPGINEE